MSRETNIHGEPDHEEPEQETSQRDTVERDSEEIVTTDATPRTIIRGWAATFAAWITAALLIVEMLLGFRLGLLLAGANAANDFADFIYDLTGVMIEPFKDIGSARTVGDDGIFEPGTLVAMGVFLAATLVLLLILWALSAMPAIQQRSVATRERQTHATRKED